MNVERTIEFILDSQAKHAARMDVIDKRMDGITKLIQQGMKLLVTSKKETDRKINALVEAQLRTDEKLKELAVAQQVTEKKLQALINRQSRNGH